MLIHYSSDGEESAVMQLSDLIANLEQNWNAKCFHGDAIDLSALRNALERGRAFTGYHEFGQFVVMPVAEGSNWRQT